MAKSAGGISTEIINTFQRRGRGMREPVDVCYIEPVTQRSIVSPDRATQADIDDTLSKAPSAFADVYRLRDGTTFNVLVVAYEDCGEDKSVGTGLLVTDSAGSLRAFVRNEFLFTRISKRADGVLDIFGCFACGDVNELRYDPEADLFYLRWVGH